MVVHRAGGLALDARRRGPVDPVGEEDGYEALLQLRDTLASEPGEEAVRQLVAGAVKELGYRAVETAGT